jgi:energy-coupling factor transporter transmembrane protein EcfT
MENACSNIITANPADVILLIFALIVLVALVGCIRTFFYAIFLFIFSRWDDSKVKLARNAIRYMIIWLFVMVMLLFVAPTLLKIFKVPNPENYSAKYIFVKVGSIVNCVSTWITRVVTDYPNNNPFGDSEYPLFDGESIEWNNWITVYQL